MDRIFELYDCVLEQHVSYHKTLKGALEAMNASLAKVAPALCKDYDEDDKIDFTLQWQVLTHKVGE